MRDFRVEIDYENGFTYFEHTGTSSDADVSSVGLVLTSRPDGALIVTGISSKAASDVGRGVLPGDKLVAIDGVLFSGKPLAAAAAALMGKPGDHKQLSIERAGASISVTTTIAELL